MKANPAGFCHFSCNEMISRYLLPKVTFLNHGCVLYSYRLPSSLQISADGPGFFLRQFKETT